MPPKMKDTLEEIIDAARTDLRSMTINQVLEHHNPEGGGRCSFLCRIALLTGIVLLCSPRASDAVHCQITVPRPDGLKRNLSDLRHFKHQTMTETPPSRSSADGRRSLCPTPRRQSWGNSRRCDCRDDALSQTESSARPKLPWS